jgi:hypothetical protein
MIATCYGGGALWGMGWSLGAARSLEQAGVPLANAPSIGCSTGAWVAAAIALGITTEELAAIQVSMPDLQPGALIGYAREVFGDRCAPSVRTVTVIDGDATPAVLPGGHRPVAELVAASAAAPGVFAPVQLGDTVFRDGMLTGSSTHADRAADADLLVVFAPLAHPALPDGARLKAVLDEEIVRWRARNPLALIDVFIPDAAAVGIIDPADPRALYRVDVGLEAEQHGRRQAGTWLRQVELVA